MTVKSLGDICEIIMGQAPAGDTYNREGNGLPLIAGASDFGETSPLPTRHTTVAAKQSRPGDIILCVRATIGDLNWSDKAYCLGRGVAGIRVIPDLVSSKYVWWALVQKKALLASLGRGATFKQINRSDIESLQIPLPPLAEQHRIATVLNQADAVCRRRREALSLLENVIQASYIELFGDLAANPRKFPIASLGEVIASVSDGPHVSPSYVGESVGIPFLSTRNINRGRILWNDMKYISVEDANVQWRKVKPIIGDILYTKGGTTGLAAAVDVDRNFAVWVHVAVLKLKNNLVVTKWLESCLNTSYCYHQSQVLTKGIANRDLGLKRMVNIKFPLPPLDLQIKYAGLLKKQDRVRFIMEGQLERLDSLFASLQHRAFRAEL